MKKIPPVFVGLDVHKDSIAVAHAAGGTAEAPTLGGTIGTRQADLEKLIRRLQGKGGRLVFTYEAGPSGYGLYRFLKVKGLDCLVVIPR